MRDKRSWLLELLWCHDVVIFVIAAVSMATWQHDLLQQQGRQRQSFCLTSMPWAICSYWGGRREKSYGFQLSALLTWLKYKEKSIKGTLAFRSPLCAPGACTHVPAWHSIPVSQGIAEFSEQTTVPIHQPAQESSSGQDTGQSQGQLLAQASHGAGSLDSGCTSKIRRVTGSGVCQEECHRVPVSRRNNKILRKSNYKLWLTNFITLR